MAGVHWSDFYLEQVRDVVPELADTPLYVRQDTEVDERHHVPHAIAFTSPICDLQLKPRVGQRWLGRGIGIGVTAEHWWSLPMQVRIGTLLHEVAHAITFFDSPWRRPEPELTVGERRVIDLGLRRWAELALNSLGEDSTSGKAVKEQTQPRDSAGSHGRDFIRCALHLQRRSRLPLETMDVFRESYRQPNPWACLNALSDELLADGDLLNVMKRPAPEAFLRLFSKPDEG